MSDGQSQSTYLQNISNYRGHIADENHVTPSLLIDTNSSRASHCKTNLYK